MPSAEIITIGTELLLGETLNTNTQIIALALRQIGVDLYRTTTIGDNPDRIAELLQERILKADILITTGGLGPTVDDPTREAIAKAFELELIFQPDLWEEIVARFAQFKKQPSENNRQQAFLPEGGEGLPNPLGTAPGICLQLDQGLLFALPGVPTEMESMLKEQVIPRIQSYYSLTGLILTQNIRVEGIGESQVDALIQDLEQLSNPTVGLSAGRGYVLIRMTAKAESENAARALIQNLENDLRNRLSEWIVPAQKP
jgi:competence/damage-inducible protein CinA-like protein